MHALCQYRHLKEAGEYREVDDRFGSLSVISGTKSWNKRKQCSDKRGTLAPQDVRRVRMRVMTEQLDSRNDAILTKWKTFNAMITSGTQPASALVALNHRRILRMVAAVHHRVHSPNDYSRCSVLKPVSIGLFVRPVWREEQWACYPAHEPAAEFPSVPPTVVPRRKHP